MTAAASIASLQSRRARSARVSRGPNMVLPACKLSRPIYICYFLLGSASSVNTGPTQLWLPLSGCFFKAKELRLNLLQPKGDGAYLSFQYQRRCWNPPSPVTKFTLFLSRRPIPNILRASSPVLREVLRYTYFCTSNFHSFIKRLSRQNH